MNVEGNLYITYLSSVGIHRVVDVKPSSKLRKEREKKGKERHRQGYSGKISFNDCLLKKVEDLNNSEDYEDNRPKRLLK